MQAADFRRWLEHPAGRLFRRFITDYGADLRTSAGELWEAGQFEKDPPASGMYRGRVAMLREIGAIKFADIELFYRQTATLEDAETDAAKRPAQD